MWVLVAACKPQRPLPERAAAAADRAVDYFARRGPSVMKTSLFALDYQRRKFGVQKLAPVVATWQRGNEHEAEVMKVLARWLDPTLPMIPGGHGPLRHPFERVLYDGLTCTQPWFQAAQFDRDLKQLTASGGYGVTHAAMASGLALENGCLTPEAVAPLRTVMVASLERIAAEEKEKNQDLFFEALATLDYLGERARVKPEWVEQVLKAQRNDGGFGMDAKDTASRDHPTALALWVLLEAAHPEAAPQPWIPK